MRKVHNPDLVCNAKSLRKYSTEEERKLWYEFLCTLPVKFTRQKVIANYIVDFCCVSKKVIIELDGAQHYEEDNYAYDRERDKFLSGFGYTVLRYTNIQFHQDFRAVCEDIWNHLNLE